MQNQRKLEDQRVLILGAYGLIGFGIAKHLLSRGIKVTGFGRDAQTAYRVLPEADWIFGDLRRYSSSQCWSDALVGISTVINCSGALQDSPNDDLEAIHYDMVAGLAAACAERNLQLIQISAVGASKDASTQFLSSKARGDQAIKNSGVRYTIFRPGLVLAPHAYGGTALLRMLAAIPLVQCTSHPGAKIQTVALFDISKAVKFAVLGKLPVEFECDLVEHQTHSLREVVSSLRAWMGFGYAKVDLIIPDFIANAFSTCADGLAWFGWKSPLRSNGIKVLAEGIKGDASKWDSLELFEISSMNATLKHMNATVEDRLSARMCLIFPLLIGVLSMFWIVSGVIGIWYLQEAASVLEDSGWSSQLSSASVMFWALIDLLLGGAILVRKFAKAACLGMVVTSIIYIIASTIFVPHLWLDPLGPLVKVFPGILLAIITSMALENR